MARISGIDTDIFPINLGGNTFGWTADEQQSFAVLDAFVAAGGNFVDTADMYPAWAPGHEGGESETVIGNWLTQRKNRDDVVIATKCGADQRLKGLARETVEKALDASLERLQTDHVDLYYAHYDDKSVDIADQVATFDALVKSGKIRAYGLSNYREPRMREFFEIARQTGATLPAAIQPEYHLLKRKAFESDYRPLVDEFGPAVFTYFSLASGMLTGKYRTADDVKGSSRESFLEEYSGDDVFGLVDELVAVADQLHAEPTTVALAWLLAKGITAPIASVSKVEQLPSLMAAADLELPAEAVQRLDTASQPFA